MKLLAMQIGFEIGHPCPPRNPRVQAMPGLAHAPRLRILASESFHLTTKQVWLSLCLLCWASLCWGVTSDITWDVYTGCSDKPRASGKAAVTSATPDVGRFTVAVFAKNGVPYTGNEYALETVYGTPAKDKDTEILNPTSFRVYGWCYAVNGVTPPELRPFEYL